MCLSDLVKELLCKEDVLFYDKYFKIYEFISL